MVSNDYFPHSQMVNTNSVDGLSGSGGALNGSSSTTISQNNVPLNSSQPLSSSSSSFSPKKSDDHQQKSVANAAGSALPSGWEMAIDTETGKTYYVDHNNKRTQWFDPRDALTKPSSFADCVGDELPVGWEYAYHPLLGVYFINHNSRTNQLDDPRMEWLAVQANMVIDYLQEANGKVSSCLSNTECLFFVPIETVDAPDATKATTLPTTEFSSSMNNIQLDNDPSNANQQVPNLSISPQMTVPNVPLLIECCSPQHSPQAFKQPSPTSSNVQQHSPIYSSPLPLLLSAKLSPPNQATSNALYSNGYTNGLLMQQHQPDLSNITNGNARPVSDTPKVPVRPDIDVQDELRFNVNKNALNFDDNSDYAVIDNHCANNTMNNYGHLINVSPKEIDQSHKYVPNQDTSCIEQEYSETSEPTETNLTVPNNSTTTSTTSTATPYMSTTGGGFNRTLLQQSLTEAKQRVAKLKRELDANYNLITIIDKYYTKSDSSRAIEV